MTENSETKRVFTGDLQLREEQQHEKSQAPTDHNQDSDYPFALSHGLCTLDYRTLLISPPFVTTTTTKSRELDEKKNPNLRKKDGGK